MNPSSAHDKSLGREVLEFTATVIIIAFLALVTAPIVTGLAAKVSGIICEWMGLYE